MNLLLLSGSISQICQELEEIYSTLGNIPLYIYLRYKEIYDACEKQLGGNHYD